MRVFQNCSAGRRNSGAATGAPRGGTFAQRIAETHRSAYDAVHTLGPALGGDETVFYTHGDDIELQRIWAQENGMPAGASAEDILLAQIEEHRSEVFYNMDLDHFDGRFATRLPSSVKAKIAWHAVPPGAIDMAGYLMVCNFPAILESYRTRGLRAAYFAPGHDPALDAVAQNDQRDIDVLFVGGYSQYHRSRALVLEAVAALGDRARVVYALSRSRLTRLAETPLGLIGPLRRHRRPQAIRRVSRDPVFGRAYYDLLGRAKIVLNGGIDFGGGDRGNMRCWEAMGARALLVTDEGNYPEGMTEGVTLRKYRTPEEASQIIEECLADHEGRQRVADAGHAMIKTRYSKSTQWNLFRRLVAETF